MGLLDSSGRGGALPGGLGGQLLPGRLASSGLTGSLLGTSHLSVLKIQRSIRQLIKQSMTVPGYSLSFRISPRCFTNFATLFQISPSYFKVHHAVSQFRHVVLKLRLHVLPITRGERITLQNGIKHKQLIM